MRSFLYRLREDARGATAIEYGLILAMIVLAIMGGVATLGGGVSGSWMDMSNKVTASS